MVSEAKSKGRGFLILSKVFLSVSADIILGATYTKKLVMELSRCIWWQKLKLKIILP